jgi:hypothetical protein
VVAKIKVWQEKNGLINPKTNQADGILGWATLEALDNVIEKTDRKYDETQNNDNTEQE